MIGQTDPTAHLMRLEIDHLRTVNAALLEALETMVNAPRVSHVATVGQLKALDKARAVIRRAKGESTHTPGPWMFALVQDLTQGVRIVTQQDLTVAAATIGGDRSRHSAEANARLIAAAPALLEALVSILSEFNANDDNTISLTSDVARAAIRQAEDGAK